MRASARRGLLLVALVAWALAPAAAQELPGLGGAEPEPEAPARPIAQASSKAEDRAIEKRLREIYAEVEGLESVSVEASAGVIRLSGEVVSSAAREKAVRIAGKLQGAVEVQDEIAEVRDVERRLLPVLSRLRERSMELVDALPLFGVALVVFALFAALGRIVTWWDAPYERLVRNAFARELLQQAVRAAFLLVGVVLALQVLDATAVVAAVAGVAGLAGLALSFAFRDLAENYIASVLLSLRQPFRANEHVVIDGHQGRVVRLTPRATILIDPDGNHVRIPNAAVFKGTILNYTRNPLRRFLFDVGVSADTDLSEALRLGLATLEESPGVIADPAPQGWVEALGDWNVSVRLTGWVDQRETDWSKGRGEAMRRVKVAFDAAGIVMPEPTLGVRAIEAAPPAAAGAPPPASAEPAVDLAPEAQTEDAIAADRASEGSGLLDASRPRE